MEPFLTKWANRFGEGPVHPALLVYDCVPKAVVVLTGLTASDGPGKRGKTGDGRGTRRKKQLVSTHAQR